MPRKETPTHAVTLGIDIGKRVFHAVGLDELAYGVGALASYWMLERLAVFM